jgi:hypothetical protein
LDFENDKWPRCCSLITCAFVISAFSTIGSALAVSLWTGFKCRVWSIHPKHYHSHFITQYESAYWCNSALSAGSICHRILQELSISSRFWRGRWSRLHATYRPQ